MTVTGITCPVIAALAGPVLVSKMQHTPLVHHCVNQHECICMQAQELSAEQKDQLQKQAEKFEGQLVSSAGDADALEGAGVTYAQLGNFSKAESLLARLTSAKPTDAEAWRLLVRSCCYCGC